ncbi:CaiB/BaiF CoA transferase family protein [Herbaspirillum chlorophenolicum]|uniref:CaiB/BaiF CoA transferase family protein n=1 Tax=Herbaspirillum chlorophenolicum TaxID=211589 RepID=UPI000772F8CC|nr:CaiB/BaiF CoA-transferase family protein [Herbaspirillum chlorophenolicum]
MSSTNHKSAAAADTTPVLPLQGLLVLDFSQFLAGPSAGLRLADLGADVIKIERPDGGDLSRQLYVSNLELDGDSTLFHTINRNKRSFAANLKDAADREEIWKLIAQADVLIQNFRPGIMDRLGFDCDSVRKANPRLVYASITGYGSEGPWRDKPGQDLLVQSLSGLTWLNGNADHGPTPVGVAVADIFTGAHLVQGILAALVRRGITGQGGRVDASLLESTLDFQFELISTYLNGDGTPPQRSEIGSASAYLSAPYGVYATADGYMAIAMNPVERLGELLGCDALLEYGDRTRWFSERDVIKNILWKHLRQQSTAYWLAILEPADIWCADVLSWPRLIEHEGFKALNMVQEVFTGSGARLVTTRCPIRIDGRILTSRKGAPKIGEDTAAIRAQFHTQENQ